MPLLGFAELYEIADGRSHRAVVSVAGGADLSVLEALRTAFDRRWVRPVIFGDEAKTREIAAEAGIPLDGFEIRHSSPESIAVDAVALTRSKQADLLMKGLISTPLLMHSVLDPEHGLRTGRVVAQVVLMEIPAHDRKFILADTGITIAPKLRSKIDILQESVQVAQALGCERPRVAMMAATETLNTQMPDTLDSAELQKRNEAGEFSDCVIQGPLSFDLAYASDAGKKKKLEGEVVGAADVMIFPNLVAANLTVKAIMYTADCRFGGVLKGTTCPVVFMSRADTVRTRLNSLSLSLRLLCE